MNITKNDLTLGDFVKFLSAKLQKEHVPLPFKDEKAWHLAFYELTELPPSDGRPGFLDSLVFDWDGRYPKCQKLSEFLHAMHWNASVTAGNPSYKAISLNEEVQTLWSEPVAQLDPTTQQFFETAVAIAQKEFAAA
jgi:hypothetical protein